MREGKEDKFEDILGDFGEVCLSFLKKLVSKENYKLIWNIFKIKKNSKKFNSNFTKSSKLNHFLMYFSLN